MVLALRLKWLETAALGGLDKITALTNGWVSRRWSRRCCTDEGSGHPVDGRLDAAQIRSSVPEWQAPSIWFCDPSAFGKALRQDFITHGLAAHDFHQELFEMG